MRKYQQRKILELLQTLEEAHHQLRKKPAPDAFVNLLADCQTFAVRIGEYIEEIEGRHTQTVSLLEKYCELAYQASIGDSGVNYSKKLNVQLIKIVDMVGSELKPNRLEVVFLPYKYAMADSLESIWHAAMADAQCDVYICPIPYYDHLSDGSLGKMHYEGELYPKDLPLVDWRKYDIEARRPDIIFTHNPYDADNYVTTVHPDFYSSRIKDFTELLCYVPYFVGGDSVKEHFCLCAGTLYSDVVFLESEKIRQAYIHAFQAFEKENNCKGAFGNPKQKFIALGSPKYDKVVNSRREDFILPDEWAKLIEGKKVVLFNTTVSALLLFNEEYLEKIRYVLDVFRARDDVVLWWRPHPLIEATYQTMRPQLFHTYKEIVTDYKRGGRGIFDETEDFHRAIAFSDAYYGDGGSALSLYQCTGKPVMMQAVKGDALLRRLWVRVFVIDNGIMYFLPRNANAIFSLDLNTGRVNFLAVIPTEDVTHGKWQYLKNDFNGISKVGDELFLVPWRANAVVSIQPQLKGVFEICDKTRRKKRRAPVWRGIVPERNVFHKSVDSSDIMSRYGDIELHTVLGPPYNLKLTSPSDYYIYRAIYEARESLQIFGL